MSSHNYEKKVNRKTNKIRQVIDEPKKKYKMQRKKNAQKKSIRETKEKKTKKTYVSDEKT